MAIIATIPITTAVTGVASAATACGTGAPESLTIVVDFAYGSSGTSGKVWLQTTVDGTTWVDIANMTFTTASKSRTMNVFGQTGVAPYLPTDGTLGDDLVKDGIVGTIYRTRLTTVGTYAGTTITVSVYPH